jgi:hypothetical protein
MISAFQNVGAAVRMGKRVKNFGTLNHVNKKTRNKEGINFFSSCDK